MERRDFLKGVSGIFAIAISPQLLLAISNNKKPVNYTIRNRSDGETVYGIGVDPYFKKRNDKSANKTYKKRRQQLAANNVNCLPK